MFRPGVERFIGELTVAVGISILFPSASVLWDMADEFMSRPFWSGLLVVFGAAMIVASARGNKTMRLCIIAISLFAWGGMLAVYAINVQRTPMAFVSVVVLVRLAQRMLELWAA